MERAEKIGLGVATAGHVLLFGLLSVGFLATPNPLKLNSPPMDVSLVDEVDLKSMAPQISTQPPPPSVAPEEGPTQDAAPAPGRQYAAEVRLALDTASITDARSIRYCASAAGLAVT